MVTSHGIWEGVDRLIDRCPNFSRLRVHGLHLLAARRFRALESGVPADIAAEERTSALLTLTAPVVLERVRAAYDGPIILIKGLEVASLYPDPVLRPFGDLDLLVGDAETAQRSLIAAGFEPLANDDSYYAERHHLRPLCWPGLLLRVEVHRRPEWLGWNKPPPFAELLSEARPASVEVDGILAPSRATHALLVAAHSWSGAPLRRLLDLIDVLLLADGLDRTELRMLARRWGIGGVWETTLAAAEALLLGKPMPWSLRLWARDLPQLRDRSVLENHIRPIAGAFWALPLHRAPQVVSLRLARVFRPAPGETWSTKLLRARSAFRHAFTDLAEHHDSLASDGIPLSEPGGRRVVGTDSPAHERAEVA